MTVPQAMDTEWAYRFLVAWWPHWEQFVPYIREQMEKLHEHNAASVYFFLNRVTGQFNAKTPFFHFAAVSWRNRSYQSLQAAPDVRYTEGDSYYIDEPDDEDETDDATNMQTFQFDGTALCCEDGSKHHLHEGSFEQTIVATQQGIQELSLDCYPVGADNMTFTSYRLDLVKFRRWIMRAKEAQDCRILHK